MAVGANSVRPFRSLTHLRKNPNHKTPPKRDVVFLQSRNCAAPLQFRIYGKPEHRRPQVAPAEMFLPQVYVWERANDVRPYNK